MKAKIVIGLLISIVVGVLLSQYSPIFGGSRSSGSLGAPLVNRSSASTSSCWAYSVPLQARPSHG
jgi:hypothetical protein